MEPEPARVAETRLVVAVMPVPRETRADLASTLAQLRELIDAIDRRLPQVQRSGEALIANAAMRLRLEAMRRISEIEHELAGRAPLDARPPYAV